ncbi:MAG: GIY-YIG nuclease family protein, partial [Cyanobacteria bacterium MAG APA_bin_95]|nr:GIY-YIG nuclease family protein [Cyanobacteria bacterium MAG APA_bin_95]
AERQAADEIARRNPCKDFHDFKPHFEQVQKELDTGLRDVHPFKENKGNTEINVGDFFIVAGQKAYVAKKGRQSLTRDGKKDARLRVVFDNGTESKMLMRSLQRALYKDHRSRRIIQAIQGPLFANYTEEGDGASGTIYVLRSHSQLPDVVRNRDLIHKIGVTSGKVEQRISNPQLDPTFLMAEVEIVATYKLYNINSKKLENLIHRIFQPAQLAIEVKDRFGHTVIPREWFLVPLHVIDQAVERIRDGTITGYVYDPQGSRLKPLV